MEEDVTGPTISSQRCLVLSVDLGGRWPLWLQKESEIEGTVSCVNKGQKENESPHA